MFRFSDQLLKAARTWPDNPAVTCAAGTLTWAALIDRCQQLAQVLAAHGVGPGDRVGFLGFNGHMGVETFYAPPFIGASVVPLNVRLAVPELIQTINDCRPRVVIVDADHADMLAACLPDCPSVMLVLSATPREGWTPYEDALAAQPATPPARDLIGGGDDMLVMYYTGGTTGRPKGVMLSHTNLFANSMGLLGAWHLPEGDAYAVTGPLFHSAAGARIFVSVFLGSHMFLQARFDIPGLLRGIEDHRIAMAQFVPTMLAMMLDHPDFGRFDTSSIRMVSYGGAPMPPDLLARTMRAFPGVRFGQAFGMTEASPIVTYLNPEDYEDLGSPRLNSLGRAAAFADLMIFDENDMPLPPGEIGEIVTRGPNVMLGYWDQPDQTAEAMRGGWYHTGDAGYLDADGYLYLSGRIKDMIITGAENVYPIEVEQVLDSHPAVHQVAVIGVPDAKWGERVHAVIQLIGEATEAELIAYSRARLAGYKCPKTMTLTRDPLPLTRVNKIDKVALRAAHPA
ncbi:AMP-binding protein [Pseudooceanicola onchidii]|uniref:AMP-binding protein n=1 Tax=Pseudooceanicola onchidii TaxID=2562279 RepID=UPI0010AA767F|nr:AMP-binding protein [Pseudooceanicola onchidii]